MRLNLRHSPTLSFSRQLAHVECNSEFQEVVMIYQGPLEGLGRNLSPQSLSWLEMYKNLRNRQPLRYSIGRL